MCQDGTSAGTVPQHDDSHRQETDVQSSAKAGGHAGGPACGGTRGAVAADSGLSGSLEENHKCCALGGEPGEEGHSASGEWAEYTVVPRGCKNRHCPDCCQSLGVKLRERVREVVRGWKACRLVTLTIDPEAVDGPMHAMERVRERRALSRLVRSLLKSGHLQSGRYFAAIEFQKNGNPHWHLLLETSFVPIERVQELWDLNRPETAVPGPSGRRGFGYVWISPEQFKSTEHAANYVTKYVLKYPQEGYPDWVLDYVGRVPKYSTSRRFWGDGPEDKEPEIEPEWCFCSRCRGEALAGVWKPVDLPPEAWETMQGPHEQHKVGILPNGLERREILFPGEPEPERTKVERRTIRDRVGACGSVGAVLLQRITVNYKQDEDGNETDHQVKTRWYWQGMLPMPFAEFVETQAERKRRYVVSPEKALELTGVRHSWAHAMWERARRLSDGAVYRRADTDNEHGGRALDEGALREEHGRGVLHRDET